MHFYKILTGGSRSEMWKLKMIAGPSAKDAAAVQCDDPENQKTKKRGIRHPAASLRAEALDHGSTDLACSKRTTILFCLSQIPV
jgi:hypothetical protein